MKLYNVPKKTWIRVIEELPQVPPAAKILKGDDILFFDHIDGMYSYCTDKDGNVVHLAAWTDVEPVIDL